MKIMRKIASAVAAVAALLACVAFGTAPAMAEGYGATVTVEGSTVTVTVTFDPRDIAQYGEYAYAEVDEALVSSVVPVKSIEDSVYYYAGHVTKESPTTTFAFKLTKDVSCKDSELAYNVFLGRNQVTGSNNGKLSQAQVSEASLSKVLYDGSVKVPATGECTTSGVVPSSTGSTTGQQLASTGATVLPYAIVAVLLAAAGVAMFAVRKQYKR